VLGPGPERRQLGRVLLGEVIEVEPVGAAGNSDAVVAADCDRVSTIIKIDDRKGATEQIEGKVRRVEERLGRKLRT